MAAGIGVGARLNSFITVTDRSRLGFSSFERNINRVVNGPMKGWNRNMQVMGVTAAASAKTIVRASKATAVLAGAMVIAGKSVGEFDKKMALIAAITGEKTVRAMDDVRKSAIDLSKKFVASANEIADGQRLLAQTGAKMNEIISGTEPILNLATSTMESFALASQLTVRTLNAMRLELGAISDTTRVVNTLQFAVNNSVNTLRSLNDALKFSAPFAQTLGIELEDLTSVIMLTANAGLEAGIAGRSIGQGLQQLIRSGMRGASDEAKAFAGNLRLIIDQGGTIADVVKAVEMRFNENTEAIMAQAASLDDLTDAQIEAIEAGQELASVTGELGFLIQLFGVRGARVFATLLGQSGQLDTFRTQMEQQVISAAEQAQVAMDNLADQTEKALHTIQAGFLNSDFGTIALEKLKKLVDSGELEKFGSRLGDLFSQLATDNLDDLFGVLEDVSSTLVQVTPVILDFSQTVIGAFTGLIESFASLPKFLQKGIVMFAIYGKVLSPIVTAMTALKGMTAKTAVATAGASVASNRATKATVRQAAATKGLNKSLAGASLALDLYIIDQNLAAAATDRTTSAMLRQRAASGFGAAKGKAGAFLQANRGGVIAAGAIGTGLLAKSAFDQVRNADARRFNETTQRFQGGPGLDKGEALGKIAGGAALGAAVGSVVPVLGTAIGAVLGAAVVSAGVLMGAALKKHVSPVFITYRDILAEQVEREKKATGAFKNAKLDDPASQFEAVLAQMSISAETKGRGIRKTWDDLMSYLEDRSNDTRNSFTSKRTLTSAESQGLLGFELGRVILPSNESFSGGFSRFEPGKSRTLAPDVLTESQRQEIQNEAFQALLEGQDVEIFIDLPNASDKRISFSNPDFANQTEAEQRATAERLSQDLRSELVRNNRTDARSAELIFTPNQENTIGQFDNRIEKADAEIQEAVAIAVSEGVNLQDAYRLAVQSIITRDEELGGIPELSDSVDQIIRGYLGQDGINLSETTISFDKDGLITLDRAFEEGAKLFNLDLTPSGDGFNNPFVGQTGNLNFEALDAANFGFQGFAELQAQGFTAGQILGTMTVEGAQLVNQISSTNAAMLSAASQFIKLSQKTAEFALATQKSTSAILGSQINGAQALNSFFVEHKDALEDTGIDFIQKEKDLIRIRVLQEGEQLLRLQNDIRQNKLDYALQTANNKLTELEISAKEEELRLDAERLKLKLLQLRLIQHELEQQIAAGNASPELLNLKEALDSSIEDVEKFAGAYGDMTITTQNILNELDELQQVQREINGLIQKQAASQKEYNDAVEKIANALGVDLSELEDLSVDELIEFLTTIADAEIAEYLMQAMQDLADAIFNAADPLGQALRDSQDRLVEMGFSASAVDDALKQFAEIEKFNKIVGFLKNFQDLSDLTGGNLALDNAIAQAGQNLIDGGGGFLDALLTITDPETLAAIFAEGSNVTQNNTKTSTISIQAELVFPDNISPEDREEIAAIAVDAVGEAVDESPFLD